MNAITTATFTSKRSGAKVVFQTVSSYTARPFFAYGFRSSRHKTRVTLGYFETEEARQQEAIEWMKACDELADTRKLNRDNNRRRAAAKQEKVTDRIKVGDILVNTWGYEQTNVNFYRVVSRTKCYATLEALECEVVSSPAWAVDRVVPGEPKDKERHPDIRGRIDIWNEREDAVGTTYGRARRWDGKPMTRSSYA